MAEDRSKKLLDQPIPRKRKNPPTDAALEFTVAAPLAAGAAADEDRGAAAAVTNSPPLPHLLVNNKDDDNAISECNESSQVVAIDGDFGQRAAATTTIRVKATNDDDDDDDRFSLSPPPNDNILHVDDDNENENENNNLDTAGGQQLPSATNESNDGNYQNQINHNIPLTTTTTSQPQATTTTTTTTNTTHPVEAYPSLQRAIVTNDGSSQNLIRLIGLKSLFSKQLPKMPKEYIARLVFDRQHVSLALLSSDESKRNTDEEIIGGICYRPYPDMRFAEIAFCAVSASQQVKGYGSKLMNLTKMHASLSGIEYFITYADNYAIGYFKKQGFTKSVQMHKARYQGLIKDYDGGTVMECYIHPSIDYTRIPEMISAQRQFILERVRTISKSDKVEYPPLPSDFASRIAENNNSGSAIGARGGTNRALAERATSIPGVIEAGWTISDILSIMQRTGNSKQDSDRKKSQLKSDLLNIVAKVSDQPFAWCFRDPVDTDEVKDYLSMIKDPIDLRTMEKQIRKGDHYRNLSMLYVDMMKMANNCKAYNGKGNPYYDHAVSLEKYLATIFPKRVVTSSTVASSSAEDGGGGA